ncbi:hypothetical protein CLVI_21520 [Clostridium vincentii]|uniref:Uncharacterized protein n=1 Tax=Clostridium vincentii TaxID=52704 RepID=A0A2T0BDJ5_9CLOT|nr:hypothetical protein CLVI_21520 [Clostridium vincentii]
MLFYYYNRCTIILSKYMERGIENEEEVFKYIHILFNGSFYMW